VIADALRTDIERFARRIEDENALFVGAAEGRITPSILASHLVNVRHLIRHTPVHLERARDRAVEAGEGALAEHFAEKLAEEQGHDRWADADLTRLRSRFGGEEPTGGPTPSLLGLLHHIEETIDRDPALYLAYILFAEYHVVLMGPRWLRLLEERCGIPASMLSVIGNHAELDQEHTAEGFEAIDALVPDPRMLAPMRETLRRSMELFQKFCAEAVEAGARGEAESCRPPSPA
jgi:hypothetical protein